MDCLHLRQRCCTPYKSRHTYQLDGVDATSSAQSDVSPSIEVDRPRVTIALHYRAATRKKKNVVLQLLHYILGTKTIVTIVYRE